MSARSRLVQLGAQPGRDQRIRDLGDDVGIDMMLAVHLSSRGISDARNFVEYVNHPSGTY